MKELSKIYKQTSQNFCNIVEQDFSLISPENLKGERDDPQYSPPFPFLTLGDRSELVTDNMLIHELLTQVYRYPGSINFLRVLSYCPLSQSMGGFSHDTYMHTWHLRSLLSRVTSSTDCTVFQLVCSYDSLTLTLITL